ncbi:putative Zn-dependent protease [Nakamurella sp. UYEF19]|uniref:TldD/PmbA family protein n=1 Tax=Nakamurella sp. UYEF19 TaxID=1756392 RepID=UPI00339300AF
MSTPADAFASGAFAPAVDRDEALERLAAVVNGGGADAMDAFVLGRTGEYTRFADGRIHQPQDITELQVMVRAVVDGHAARAATSSLRGLERAAIEAIRMARSLAATASSPGRAVVASVTDHPDTPALPAELLRHSSTAAFDEGARVAVVRDAIDSAAAAGGSAAGMIGRALNQLVVVTSDGIARATAATEAMAGLTVAVDDSTSHFIDLGRSADRLHLGRAVSDTVAQAVAGRGRGEPTSGEYTVVLGPEATAELLEFLPGLGFSGELAAAGVGLWSTSAGRKVAGELVDVADDALVDLGLPIGFDIEGVPKRRVPFFGAGVVGSPVTDLRTAAQLGVRSSGHAHIAREEVPETRAANIVMRTGTSTEAELIAGVERGVYLQRFWYTRLVDRTAGTITGVTRDACFEIVNGRLGRPLAGIRFTQSVLALLDGVDGVADVARTVPVMNVWNGATTAPAIRANGFRLGAAPILMKREGMTA